MLTPIEDKISQQRPEYAEIMIYLRKHLVSYNKDIVESYKFFSPYYDYKGKGLCYMHFKNDYVYLGFYLKYGLKHPKLEREGRKVVSAFKCYINKNIDIRSLNAILKLACAGIDKKLKS